MTEELLHPFEAALRGLDKSVVRQQADEEKQRRRERDRQVQEKDFLEACRVQAEAVVAAGGELPLDIYAAEGAALLTSFVAWRRGRS